MIRNPLKETTKKLLPRSLKNGANLLWQTRYVWEAVFLSTGWRKWGRGMITVVIEPCFHFWDKYLRRKSDGTDWKFVHWVTNKIYSVGECTDYAVLIL